MSVTALVKAVVGLSRVTIRPDEADVGDDDVGSVLVGAWAVGAIDCDPPPPEHAARAARAIAAVARRRRVRAVITWLDLR
jgi:hypothetical protein